MPMHISDASAISSIYIIHELIIIICQLLSVGPLNSSCLIPNADAILKLMPMPILLYILYMKLE